MGHCWSTVVISMRGVHGILLGRCVWGQLPSIDHDRLNKNSPTTKMPVITPTRRTSRQVMARGTLPDDGAALCFARRAAAVRDVGAGGHCSGCCLGCCGVAGSTPDDKGSGGAVPCGVLGAPGVAGGMVDAAAAAAGAMCSADGDMTGVASKGSNFAVQGPSPLLTATEFWSHSKLPADSLNMLCGCAGGANRVAEPDVAVIRYRMRRWRGTPWQQVRRTVWGREGRRGCWRVGSDH